MRGAFAIDIAWSLPAKARRVQAATQRSCAEFEALSGQVRPQQRHRPAVGVVAVALRIARQQRGEPLARERGAADRAVADRTDPADCAAPGIALPSATG
jgi:hypothetical protein